MINWELFFDDTSGKEYLMDFVEATIDLDELYKYCLDNERKKQVGKMQDLEREHGIEYVEDLVVKALRRREYDIKVNKEHSRRQRYIVE